MSVRWWVAGLAAAAVVVAAAVWIVLGAPGAGPGAAGAAAADRQADGSSAAGGVAAREISSARDRVAGRVVDEDGVAVTDGSVALACLESDPPGRPVPGGVVELDAEGRFEGPGCRGPVCVELMHGSLIRAEPWSVHPGGPVELSARALSRLEGTVLDPSGAPVASAQITMVAPPDDEDPTALPPFTSRNASTDADGRFSFARLERPPCDACAEAAGRCQGGAPPELPTYSRMLVVVRADGFRIAERPVDVSADEALEIRLEAAAAPIRGRLQDPDGRPYPRARVLARSLVRPYEQHAAEPAGLAFRLTGLSDGDYALRAVQDGIELAEASPIAAGHDVVLEGSAPADGPELIVEVRDRDRRPLAGARVDGGPFTGARSDASGRVRATAVIPGRYTLRVHGPDGDSGHEVEVAASDAPIQVVLVVP